MPGSPRRLLDQVREKIRLMHYSIRTGRAYVGWLKRFVVYHGPRHPRDLGPRARRRPSSPIWRW
ncbi:MAG: phage integrase N-terminal SAM-like domain-containing protein [Rhodocyclaceae bacterium]|nr:phage integrase N-terminal SAM-like domain-containing protein [Rhodocyclaceae bacterium]